MTILLVEDNDAHAELVIRGLRDQKMRSRICHVQDGEEALDYLFRRNQYEDPEKSPRPGLILLDLRLPKIDGLEVLKTIKTNEQMRAIPVVILTTSEADSDVKHAYMQYANSYLVKPVDFSNFNTLLSDLGFYWLGWNHRPN
ncbi:response regulator [Paucidesulfovibrio gracilis]|nr:response regulator [Paucidesulfovibrio gracilis]